MKILQNQEKFDAKRYREVATSLWRASSSGFASYLVSRCNPVGLLAGAAMYLLSDEYDIVVTIGPRPTLAYGLACRLMGKRAPVHVAKEFYLTSGSFAGWHRRLYGFALKHLDVLVVNARAEAPLYARLLGLEEERMRFIAWPSNIDAPEPIRNSASYYIAAGRSMRDWPTFCRAVTGIDRRFVVVATKKDSGRIWPDNVELFVDIPRSQYIDLLRDAEGMVLPLLATERSTGQATFLEAMSFGKPVVAARVVGCADYIDDGVNGLLYTPENSKDLRSKIARLLEDDALRARLRENGIRSIQNSFNKEAYAERMLDIMEETLCRRSGVPQKKRPSGS